MQFSRLVLCCAIVVVVAFSASLPQVCQAADWKKTLDEQLPLLGHRNWIVVADLAYPLQSRPGIKTIYAGGDHIQRVKEVLAAVEKAPHVRPLVFLDSEQPFVPEKNAPGIDACRNGLAKVLKGKNAQSLPHEEIIGMLDEAAKTFNVLIIKTDMVLPYTTVFMRLECGYWGDEAEKQMRAAMEKAEK
jgi:hypothetical protein